MKQYIQVLNLCVVFVLMLCFVGKIVRVDVDNNLTRGGDLLVNKYDTADNNHTHPYS